MEFGVLGPLEVRDGDRGLLALTPRQRSVLGMLLLRANRVVSTDQLIEAVWGAAPPRSAAVALQMLVSRLRRVLQPDTTRLPVVVTRPHGYLLQVAPGELDLQQFEELVAAGRQALATGAAADAARCLRQALGLWRGPVLAGLDVGTLQHTVVPRLEEARLAAEEERIEAELLLGRHRQLVGELQELVAEYPLRERLCGQLMLALYRAGRQAEALAAYGQARRRLVEELGIEPGTELQRLQRQILAADPALDAPPRLEDAAAVGAVIFADRDRPAPRQLPPDVVTFTGRELHLARLDRLLGMAGLAGSVMMVAIDGISGIGKSALAIHAAHRLAEQFPDGQLYVNLQGATPGLAPLQPLEVLGRFLRALGVDPTQVPTQVDEAAAWFRSLVAGRRLLVMLDDARDAVQVAPLLPASPACGVLVTSRCILAGLDGVHYLHLDVLPPEEAVRLLARLAGEQRIVGEPRAAAEVTRLCGFLPLALRIAGARLAARRGWSVRALASRLADAQHRLDELELGDLGVRASFSVSLRTLCDSVDAVDRAAARAFGLLGVLDGPEVSLAAAARLLDRSHEAAERALERLVDAQLLESHSPGRYRMHDLLRLYAREHAGAQYSEAELHAAMLRALGFYVATAWTAFALLRPGDLRLGRADERWRQGGLGFEDAAGALAWLEAERVNLLAAVGQAAGERGVPDAVSLQLAQALLEFLWVRGYWQDLVAVNQTALRVSRRVGDRAAQAQAHNDLAGGYWRLGHHQRAMGCLQESLAIFRQLGDAHGEAASLGNLGNVHELEGRYADALACTRRSLAMSRELGDRDGQALCLDQLGRVLQQQGRHQEAVVYHREGLAILQELGSRDGQAVCLNNLALALHRLGQDEQALRCMQEGLAISREVGNRCSEAESIGYLAQVYRRQGRHADALAYQQQSLSICQELGGPHGQAEALRELGVTLAALGRHEEALAHWRQALAIFEKLQTPDADEVRALLAGQLALTDR
jgi:DNA-binding SARP family transcriptional activator